MQIQKLSTHPPVIVGIQKKLPGIQSEKLVLIEYIE